MIRFGFKLFTIPFAIDTFQIGHKHVEFVDSQIEDIGEDQQHALKTLRSAIDAYTDRMAAEKFKVDRQGINIQVSILHTCHPSNAHDFTNIPPESSPTNRSAKNSPAKS